MNKREIPLVFIIFNRPDTTEIVFKKIKEYKPKKLYIISDGPRDNNTKDVENCKKTRKIVEDINWDCQIFKKYSDVNLGCGINISSGLDWVFNQEEMAIILEDDCLPANGFFEYCEELLIKYKDEPKIMHIGGTNWHPEYKQNNNDSYFFSKDAHIWGWATWKRAWKYFDYYLTDYPTFIETNAYKKIITNKDEQKYFKERWGSFHSTNYNMKSRSNWDYQWYFAVLKKEGLCIWPKENLISNIGLIGTHTSIIDQKLHFKDVAENFKIINHPLKIEANMQFDLYHYYNFNHRTFVQKLINKIFKYLGI